MSEIVFNEENTTYKRDADLFLNYNKEKKRPLLPKKPDNIKAFLKDLKEGYPNQKPKAQGTLKAKLMAIKNLYKLNGVEEIDFISIQKFIPTLFPDKEEK